MVHAATGYRVNSDWGEKVVRCGVPQRAPHVRPPVCVSAPVGSSCSTLLCSGPPSESSPRVRVGCCCGPDPFAAHLVDVPTMPAYPARWVAPYYMAQRRGRCRGSPWSECLRKRGGGAAALAAAVAPWFGKRWCSNRRQKGLCVRTNLGMKTLTGGNS